jgi:putative endonuclease
MSGYFYILASQRNSTLYAGVANDLSRRMFEHQNNLTKGFTAKQNIHLLVYYELYDHIEEAIAREKQI